MSGQTLNDWTDDMLLGSLKECSKSIEQGENFTIALMLVAHELGKRRMDTSFLIAEASQGITEALLEKVHSTNKKTKGNKQR